jgi:hypothetical protein
MSDTLDAILELARWAPSGDNTQPWRFEIVAADHVVVHGFDTRDHCVYDLTGHPSQISIGAMLETLRIAAAAQGYSAAIARRLDSPDTHPRFDVCLSAATVSPIERSKAADLASAIKTRAVQRRPLRTTPLTAPEKTALTESVGPAFDVIFIEELGQRLRVAALLWSSAWLRLTMREAYEVHRSVIEWGAKFSEERIPAAAVGVDPLTSRLMGWAMQDWARVQFMNRYLAGTVLPRVQLDLIPAIACAVHVVLVAKTDPKTIDHYVAAGAAVQRLWLTATRLGLQHQPELTPLIFSGYAREGRMFSADPRMMPAALELDRKLGALIGAGAARRAVWLGRLGRGKAADARSLRLPLNRLIVSDAR